MRIEKSTHTITFDRSELAILHMHLRTSLLNTAEMYSDSESYFYEKNKEDLLLEYNLANILGYANDNWDKLLKEKFEDNEKGEE